MVYDILQRCGLCISVPGPHLRYIDFYLYVLSVKAGLALEVSFLFETRAFLETAFALFATEAAFLGITLFEIALLKAVFLETAFFETALLGIVALALGFAGCVQLFKFAVLAAQYFVCGVEVVVLVVAFCIVKALFEFVAVGAETALVAHQPTLYIGFHLATLGTEVAELAAEQLVLAEVAVELAVEYLCLEAGTQAKVFKQFGL